MRGLNSKSKTAATKTPEDELFRAVERVVVRANLKGFTGDLQFIQNDYAKRIFSKLRSSLGGVYAWRADHSADLAEKERMTRAADLAFRQAFALCPYSPEAVFRYTTLLTKLNRLDDALLLAKTCQKLEPGNGQFTGLAQKLKNMKATGAR